MTYKKEIIAVLDPMCSWCWGFEPVLKDLKKNLPKNFRVAPGQVKPANQKVAEGN